ncbi:hypothetical protein TrST_g904 [Triparma strigata]|uniref:DNA 5'-3' helicase n=1 Tax=Triparma strigata TaxID=1606541 RepID=A0A9W7EEG7_9STRA|nr:hypothetical protein TrST_g904 [Triparma strigata]
MRFDLDGLDVFFPFPRLYREQYLYMKSLKQALDSNGHCLLEMPTGTGKTACLLSLITSYQYAHPERGKLIYCTRTVPEMDSVMEELVTVLDFRERCLSGNNPEEVQAQQPPQQPPPASDSPNSKRQKTNVKSTPPPPASMGESASPTGAGGTNVLGLCLSSRRNMCIHSEVMEESDRELVDNACRKKTASWVRAANEKNPGSVKTCEYYEGYEAEGVDSTMPSGVYDLETLRSWGLKKGWCPYYLTRRAINHANILVFNYQYMLDPKVAKMVSKELEQESIIVFDEAHNLDNICIEALSVEINELGLEKAGRSLNTLQRQVASMKANDAEKLRREYRSLVDGLVEQGLLPGGSSEGAAPANNPTDTGLGSAVLSSDVINEAVPGNIRRAEHFVAFMKKLVEHLKARLNVVKSSTNGGVVSESPMRFLHHLKVETHLEAKPLKFCYSRLSSLLRTLEVSNLDEFNYLNDVADFATLLATYSEGIARFAVIMEPNGSSIPGAIEPRLQLACLDSSLAIAPLFKRFSSVVITSGTLSPIDLYPKLLDFEPRVSESFSMSTFRPCIRPLIVSRGSDQTQISTRYQDRDDPNVTRNYGQLMVDLCSSIPDGIVAFFTSYSYLETIVVAWELAGVLKQISEKKLIFIETKDVMETSLALTNYRKACDSGKGAVFLSVARGKVSEGINFDRHYGRAVILFGVPFQYTKSHVLIARLEFLQTHYNIKEADFLNFDALRQASQCVGRVIRSKTDYGLMIFADARYNRRDKRNKLPKWIKQFLLDGFMNLSSDVAVSFTKQFLREMSQPIDQKKLQKVFFSAEELTAMETKLAEARKVEGGGHVVGISEATEGGQTITMDVDGSNDGAALVAPKIT